MMRKSNKSFREQIAESFIKALEEEPREWHKNWTYTNGLPINLATNRPYNGVNRFYLKHVENEMNYNDYRWATFNQICENGWHLKKGSIGVKVEYWLPVDNQKGKAISWKVYDALSPEEQNGLYVDKDGSEHRKYNVRARYYTVFNACQIEGVPELELDDLKLNDISPNVVVDSIATGLGIKIKEQKNSSSAYYNLLSDEICMPLKSQFKDDYSYQATALHELGHATGSSERLNRDLSGVFGSPEYAYEELVAEITSTFMGEYFKEPISKENMDDHIAYVQNWIQAIKGDKNYLFRAIKDAEQASNYMIEKGGLDKLREKNIEIEPPIQEHPETFIEKLKSRRSKRSRR